jgi:predicted thioesterase
VRRASRAEAEVAALLIVLMSASPTLQATRTATVTDADTAARFGPDFPPAASTPFVLGLAEVACHDAVAGTLTDGEITVGTGATIKHSAPSPVGTTLTAVAKLEEQVGRRLRFAVVVRDADGLEVAHLEHHRAVVDRARIMERLAR